MTDLGSLGGNLSFAVDINNRGQVVGNSNLVPNFGVAHAFLWEDGVMTDLGTLGGSRSEAIAINDRGQVVGWSSLAGDTNLHAFLWDDGVMTDLGSLPGTSSSSDPAAISRRGTVAGNTNTRVGFYWEDGVMVSVGTLGGPATSVFDLNDRRQVVGAHARQCAAVAAERRADGIADESFVDGHGRGPVNGGWIRRQFRQRRSAGRPASRVRRASARRPDR